MRPDNPGTAEAIGSPTSSLGWTHSSVAPPTPGNNFLVRFGVWAGTATGTFGNADVDFQATVSTAGEAVGNQTLEIQPYNDNTEVAFFGGTPWLPAVGLTWLRAAQIATGNLNTTTQTSLAYRTANDLSLPSAWTQVGSYVGLSAGNSERVTASDITGVDTANQHIQLGWAVRRTSGGLSRVTLNVAFAVIRGA